MTNPPARARRRRRPGRSVPYLSFPDGFRLYYEVHRPSGTDGSDSGASTAAVLLAHGAGGNTGSWWQQLPVFAQHHTVIAFDHRAFGRSPDIEDGPGRSAFADDAIALLEHLGVQRVHIVAHSMGGRTAMGFLRRAPERVASLVCSGTNAGCVDERLHAKRAELCAAGAFGGSLRSRALAPDFATREPVLAARYDAVRANNPPRSADFLAPRPDAAPLGSTAQRLRDSGLPLLWIVGELDRIVPPALARISHALTPGSRYSEVAGAGHSAYFERPEAWNAAVLGFIADVESTAAEVGQ